jgi:hypothetical protein
MAHAGLIGVDDLKEHAKPFSFHDGVPVLAKEMRSAVNFRG